MMERIGTGEMEATQSFCMKKNIVFDVPLDIAQAIADLRPPRKFIVESLCFSINGAFAW